MGVIIQATANNSSTATAASFTFTAQAIGAAGADRVVLVAVFARTLVGTGGPITGVTIGGNAATSLVTDPGNATTGIRLGIFGLLVASGTTADIVVTTSGNANRVGIGVYSMNGTGGSTTVSAQSGATETAANPISTTITIPANGAGLAVSATNGASGVATWSGLTKDVDVDINSDRFTTAFQNYVSQQVGLTVSTSYANPGDTKDLVVGAWAPAVTTNNFGGQMLMMGVG